MILDYIIYHDMNYSKGKIKFYEINTTLWVIFFLFETEQILVTLIIFFVDIYFLRYMIDRGKEVIKG
jgi:hypothetical protein